MIRKLEKNDVNEVMNIWLNVNKKTHYFISIQYWESNFKSVQKAILEADTYVFIENNTICGFIGIVDRYIAGIFVKEDKQSKGIGKELLDYCKLIYSELELNVYKKNIRAIKFYQKEKFYIVKEVFDEENNETEFVMKWSRNITDKK